MQLFTRWSRLFICWCILQWLSTNTTQPPRSVVKTHFHVKTVIKLKMGLSKIARLNVQTNNYSVIQHLWYRMYKTINHPQFLLESIKHVLNWSGFSKRPTFLFKASISNNNIAILKHKSKCSKKWHPSFCKACLPFLLLIFELCCVVPSLGYPLFSYKSKQHSTGKC